MPILRQLRAATALGGVLLVLGPGPAAAATDDTAGCDLHYTVQPRPDTTPRRLDVTLRFAAEGRAATVLRLTPGWGGVDDFATAVSGWTAAPDGVRIAALGETHRWQVQHPAQGEVTVAYQVQAALPDPDDGRAQPQEQLYRVQIGADWFQFFGHAVLPSVEAWGDDRPGRMCLTLHPAAGRPGPLLGSHFDGRPAPAASARTVQFDGAHARLRHAVYAGGPGWRVLERPLASGPVLVAVRGRHGFDDTQLADAVARLVDVQRRFWGDVALPRQHVLVTPNFSPGNNGGTRVHQASVLHVGARFRPGEPGFEFLIGHESLHDWLPGRLGGHGGGDAVSAARHHWLSEGFTDYYTHRLLLASGQWGLPQYAAKLTQVLQGYWRSSERHAGIDSLAPRFFSHRDAGRQLYARGEMLAMHWDRALRERGHAGLDALLRGLLLPAGSAAGAAGAAPAHERVMAALTAELGPGPQQDLQRLVGQGRELPLDAGLAGPCFTLGWQAVPRWVLGFDPRSFQQKQALGVVPEGPAWRAGLREGMPLAGWSVHGGDVLQDVVLWARPVGEPEARAQALRYRPVDGSSERLPQLQVREGAQDDAACTAWQRR